MPTTRGLPHGRPIQQSPIFKQADERKRSIPKREEGWLSVCDPYVYTGTTTTAADRLVLFAVPPLEREIHVDYGYIQVTTAVAATSAKSGVYVYDARAQRFTLIPHTEVQYDTTSTGRKEAKLPRDHVFVPEARYYIGYRVTNSTVAIAAVTNATGVISRRYIDGSTGDLPASTSLDGTIATQAGGIPGVVYIANVLGL